MTRTFENPAAANFGEHAFHGELTLSPTPSAPLAQHRLTQRENATQVVLCFGSCIETPCNPKRSPLSEMTCPASSTAVVSLLPVPKRMPSNSALESASGPSDNSRSRGLSSGGSCLIVYLRASTAVFYIVQISGISVSARSSLRLPLVSISTLQFVSKIGCRVSMAFVEPASAERNSWARRLLLFSF